MSIEEKIARINELYHKSEKGGGPGLTSEELEEQKKLRQEYIASIRGNLRSQLDNIRILNEDGTVTKPGKVTSGS